MKKVIVISVIALFVCVGSSITGVNIEQIDYSLNAGELAWWKSDECDGTTLYDCSSHNYDGTIYGADWTPGCCLNFDGVDDYVDLDNHSLALGINKTDDCEVHIRFKSEGSGMLYSMSHTNPERPYFDIILTGDGNLGFISGDITCVFELYTDGTYDDGDWHIFIVEYFGDTTNPTVNLYVDGDLDGTLTDWVCPQIDEDYETVKVGRNSNTEEDFFAGEIDDIKFYKNTGTGTPPEITTIDGPSEGVVGTSYTFTFNAVDPDVDDNVRFHIDWGDGEEWTTYVPQGTDKEVAHQYNAKGNYVIEAYAQDDTGLIGPTGTHPIVIPRDKAVYTHPFLQFLQNHPNMFQIIKYILGL
jgi:hypothetical protein